MFIQDPIDRELHFLKCLELKFGLRVVRGHVCCPLIHDSSFIHSFIHSFNFQIFLAKHLLESFLMCSFVCSGFLTRLFVP